MKKCINLTNVLKIQLLIKTVFFSVKIAVAVFKNQQFSGHRKLD
jgi:hypothetical protein